MDNFILMEDILVWALVAFGITNGLSLAHFFRPIWWKLAESKKIIPQKFGQMMACPMCLGFWVGALLHVAFFSLTGNIILDMFASSAICWILYTLCYTLSKGEL